MGADLNQGEPFGATALGIACLRGHMDVARFLLSHGATSGQADPDGVSPILRACCAGQVDIVRLLLESGVTVTSMPDHGLAPLHAACCSGHLPIARLLLQHRASLDATLDGQTALDAARAGGHAGIVQLVSEALGEARQEGREPKRRRRMKGPP